MTMNNSKSSNINSDSKSENKDKGKDKNKSEIKGKDKSQINLNSGYVFYDLETTGLSPHFDQIVQVAALKTDLQFNILNPKTDVLNLRCNRLPWIVPSPQAMCVTGVTPEQLERSSLSHFEMMNDLVTKFNEWSPAIFIGHNSLRFDDEMLRHSLFSSLHPAYLTAMPPCGRADTLSILKAITALEPDAIHLPIIHGKPSMRLGPVLRANGIVFDEAEAHDALADVRGTIQLAQLMHTRAPVLFNHMIGMATKADVKAFLDAHMIFKHVTYFGAPHIALCTPIAANPANPNQLALFDLAQDPEPFFALSVEELIEALEAKPRLIQTVKLSAQPALCPLDFGQPVADQPANHVLEARAVAIALNSGFKARIREALEMIQMTYSAPAYIEQRLYTDGFPSQQDQGLAQDFHLARSWTERLALAKTIVDKRLRFFALRIIYSQCPAVLPTSLLNQMHDWTRDRLLTLDHPTPFRTIHLAIEELEAMQPPRHHPDTGEPLDLMPDQHARIDKLDAIKTYLLMLASGHQ